MSGAAVRACHRCGTDIGTVERVGRRDACLRCGSDLHCCRNCEHYAPAAHNQCREPQSERQVEKESGNFCDYFRFRRGALVAQAPASGARAQLDAMFRKKERP